MKNNKKQRPIAGKVKEKSPQWLNGNDGIASHWKFIIKSVKTASKKGSA